MRKTVVFNAQTIQAQWSELGDDTWTVSSPVEQAYFSFYGIAFEHDLKNVVHHFGYIEVGEFNIATHYFDNASQTKGTVFLLHGYFDHVGLYRHVIEFYLSQGFSVIAFDLPGHGLSTGERVSIKHFSDYADVLDVLIKHFKDRAPQPFSMFGQSTGCAVVMEYLLGYPRQEIFKNITFFSPLIRPAQWWHVNYLYYVCRLLFIKRVKRVFLKNSNDKKFLEFLEQQDPLQDRTVSVQWVHALKEWISSLSGRAACAIPICIVQGKADDTVDWSFNIPVIENLFPNANVFYLNNAKHHLANESDELRKEVFLIVKNYFK